MFLSNVNLLDDSSLKWNLLHISKIVKIPDDQLKLLNSIPEWSSHEQDQARIKSPTTVENSNQIECEQLVPDLKEKKTNQASLKLSNNSVTVEEYNTFPKEMYKSVPFPTSPNKHFELRSHVDERMKCTKKTFVCSENMEEVIDEIREQNSLISQFTNSAIQCQMSQSSQPNFEDPTSERIILPSANIAVNNDKNEESNCIKSDESQGFIVDSVDKIKVSSDIVHSLNDLKKKEVDSNTIKVVEKDIEESFVSQPIPCAQPSIPKENIVQKDFPLSTVSSSSVLNENIPNSESNTELNSDKRSHQHASKRKRKARVEKTKKLRSTYASDNEILYSSDQIKSMIDLIKIFNKL